MAKSDAEFPSFPKDYEGIIIEPEKILYDDNNWTQELTIKNNGDHGVIFKVKTSSNQRCEIKDCADFIPPQKGTTVLLRGLSTPLPSDKIMVVYTQYAMSADTQVNAFVAWQRAKNRDVICKNLIIPLEKK